MNGYFDALLRAAGSPLAAAPPAAGLAPARDAADLPEQETAIETPAPPPDVPMAVRPPAHPGENHAAEKMSRALEPTAAGEPDRSPQPRGQAPSAAPHQPEAGLVSSPLTTLAAEGEVHPVVRAALRWVAADPSVVEREVGGPGVPAESASAPVPAVEHAPTRPARAAREGTGERATARDVATRDLIPRAAPTPPPPADHEMDLTWPSPAPPERPRAEVRRRPPAEQSDQSDQIEIHIGTIHVAVDAPAAPRATVQPAAPSSRPQARPAPRSGFGRSRLPRF